MSSLLCITEALAQESHPGLDSEVMYAEASLAFNRQNPVEALQLLDKLLAAQPDHVESLELKALILKSNKEDRPALQIYQRLCALKPLKQRGPYYFESAVILARLSRFNEAITYYEASLALGFNASSANLFLGMLRFNHNGAPKKAETNFREVLREGLPEMQAVAHYYLGLIAMKAGSPSNGKSEMLATQGIADSIPENKTAQDSATAAKNLIASFGEGRWFANFSTTVQSDSNISTVPDSGSLQSQPSYRSTFQDVLSLGLGYMSAASKKVQWVPTFQSGYNHNFNALTRGTEYLSNNATLYLNYHALEATTGGLKLSGTYTFQNTAEDPSNLEGNYTMTKYSAAGDFGPYLKFQINPRTRLEWEGAWRPSSYFSSPTLNGSTFATRFTFKAEGESTYWSPSVSLSYEQSKPESESLRYTNYGISFSDSIRLTFADTITLGLDFTRYDYYRSSPRREDSNLNPRASIVHTLNGSWSLTGNLSYTAVLSTVSSVYAYTRFIFGIGIGYSL